MESHYARYHDQTANMFVFFLSWSFGLGLVQIPHKDSDGNK